MKYFWREAPGMLPGIARRKKILFLDFDGTLAPIERRPEDVFLPPSTGRLLARLGKSCRLVIISGRLLSDLRRRCGLPDAIYVGNHGLQIHGISLRLPEGVQMARRQAAQIPHMARRISRELSSLPGVQVENKRLTISIHYRRLAPALRPIFCRKIVGLQKSVGHYPVIWRRGKKVWEVRPKRNWGKGDAVRTIRARFRHDYPIVLGDDETDEDMFRAVGAGGLTVRVGRKRLSQARYYLKSQSEVADFLRTL